MVPIPSSLVGYHVSSEAIKQYRSLKNIHEYKDQPLLQDLESNLGVPLALIRIEDTGTGPDRYYLCCFADYSGRTYSVEDLLAVPVPPAFYQLPQLIPVEGDLQRLFAPMATLSSYDQSGKSRVNERALPIGGEHV